MKQPWQIWSIYALCLLIVVPAMIWLSHKTMQLDRLREEDRAETELARREAELQGRINSALWRMDWMLTPLVAQEAARPYYLYESFYRRTKFKSNQTELDKPGGKQPTALTVQSSQPSPLLFQPSDFVVLHFQITPDNQLSSPQRPVGLECQLAISSCGLTESDVQLNDSKLEEARSICDYQSLIIQCPSLKLPDAQLASTLRTQIPPFDQGGNRSAPSQAQIAQVPMPRPQQSAAANNDENNSAQQGALNQTLYVEPQMAEIQQKVQQLMDSNSLVKEFKGKKREAQIERNLDRGNQEWAQRRRSAENFTYNQWLSNNFNPLMAGPDAIPTGETRFVRESIMRPLWIDNRLMLVRRVEKDQQDVIQCCWLNWERIQAALKNEVQRDDLLPQVELQPIQKTDEIKLGHALATLPVRLVVNSPEMIAMLGLHPTDDPELGQSGLRMSLIIAWCGLGLAAIAGAFLLHGVIQLSERRGAFVSAVSHEMRTPLTTFRMYAEMLAEKMVPPEKQQRYAQTLKVESERLSHLVENVLQFARLERDNKNDRMEPVTMAELLDRFGERLTDRARRAGMEFVVELQPELANKRIKTDPAAIEQILFNLVDNACKYARNAEDKRIVLDGWQNGGKLRLAVCDFGPGVYGKDKERMFQPFRKSDQDAANSAPGVGLGLALCRRMAKALGGRLELADTACGAKLVLEIPTND